MGLKDVTHSTTGSQIVLLALFSHGSLVSYVKERAFLLLLWVARPLVMVLALALPGDMTFS